MECRSCKEYQQPEKFSFRKDTQKYQLDCKKCINKKTQERKKNGLIKTRTQFNFICIKCQTQQTPESFYLKDKEKKRYDTVCMECRKKGARNWHTDNKETSLKNKKLWHTKNRDKNIIKFRENYKKRMKENPEKERGDRKKWRIENNDKVNARARYRYANDINFKLRSRLHENCYRIIKRGCKKNCKTLRMLGCSIADVRGWLESQFTNEMTWENHGKFWHIDHFFPVVCYNLTDPEEQNKCFHWSNLRPLKGCDNLSKGRKIPSDEEQFRHNSKIVEYEKHIEEKSIVPATKGTVAG